MTTKEKLLVLEEEIRRCLPRLKTLGVGCVVRNKSSDVEYVIVSEHNGIYLLNECNSNETWNISKKQIETHNPITIIGHKPTMGDVLEWLERFGYLFESYISCHGEFLIRRAEYGEEFVAFCDLREPYLEQQSYGLIYFLYGLIGSDVSDTKVIQIVNNAILPKQQINIGVINGTLNL